MNNQEVANAISATVAEGYPDYNVYAHAANSIVLFRDKTLNEWTDLLSTPTLPPGANIHQLEAYNFEILRLNEIVIKNLSYARATLATAKMLYKRKLDEEKAKLFEDRDVGSKRLSIDAAESIAKRNIAEILHAYELSELFEEYWSVQFQKIELLNDRLTSLNILKNHEVKVGGHV